MRRNTLTYQGISFLFWLIHLPFTFLRPYQLKKFFWLKAIVMLPAIFGLFIFCMVNTRGKIGLGHISNTSSSSANGWGWFFVSSINAGMGNSATLITNQPDIARWSRTKAGAMYSQLISNPIAVTLSASLGILATAAINNAWGLELWNQWDLLDAILTRYWSAGTRTAVFLAAAGWCVSLLGTNIAANMIPFGSDSTMLFPRYLTIPRGQLLVEILGFAICPWKIMASAATFTTFLSGYGLFMASVVAIMIADYYLLTGGNVFIEYLYDGSKDNKHYYYHRGWNVQAVLAYVIGVVLPFPGFVGTLGANVSIPAENLGHLGVSTSLRQFARRHLLTLNPCIQWMLSFVVTFTLYWAICYVWPTRSQKQIRAMNLKWEEMSYRVIPIVNGVVVSEETDQVRDIEYDSKAKVDVVAEDARSVIGD